MYRFDAKVHKIRKTVWITWNRHNLIKIIIWMWKPFVINLYRNLKLKKKQFWHEFYLFVNSYQWLRIFAHFYIFTVKPPGLTGVKNATTFEAGNANDDDCNPRPVELQTKGDRPRIMNHHWQKTKKVLTNLNLSTESVEL